MGSWVGCSACPFKGHPDTQCWAGTYAQSVCQILEGKRGDEETRESYRRMNYERSTGKGYNDFLPNRKVSAPSPKPGTPEFKRAGARGRLLVYIAENCGNRGDKIGQGCNCQYACGLGHGSFEPGIVSATDCMECIQGRPPRITSAQSAVEPPTPTPLELHHLSE